MSMTWIAVAIDIGDDDRIGHMADACGKDIPATVGHVVLMLGKLPRHARSGDISGVSNTSLEEWAKWRGEPGQFAQAFRAHMCTEAGIVRAWEKLNGAAMREAEAAAERMRVLRQRRKEAKEAAASAARNSGPDTPPSASRPRRARDKERTPNRSRNVPRTFTTDRDSDITSGPGGPEERAAHAPVRDLLPVPAQPDPVAQALLTAAEQALLGDASPSERAAIERVASSGDRDVIVIELWEMGTDPRHQVRGEQRTECVSSLDHVRRAVVEFAAKGRIWDASYMRGCVRRVVDRRPEPLTSAQRAARDAAAVRHHVAPVVHEPETPEQQAERRRRSAEAMAQFRAQSGMPATRIADVIERMVS